MRQNLLKQQIDKYVLWLKEPNRFIINKDILKDLPEQLVKSLTMYESLYGRMTEHKGK